MGTWAKMMMVCIDLAYPDLGLLASQCDVGIGAQAPLRCLLEADCPNDSKLALKILVQRINASATCSSEHFWTLLPKVESMIRIKFKHFPLMVRQVNTSKNCMSAVTTQ